MDREEKLKAIREAYTEWEKTATFVTSDEATPEDEEKIFNTIQTIIENNKPQQIIHSVSLYAWRILLLN